MPYDQSLDQKIFSQAHDFDMTRISVSVFSYNNGPKKIQISRENKDFEGNWRFAKLGRVTKDEAVVLNELLAKALENID